MRLEHHPGMRFWGPTCASCVTGMTVVAVDSDMAGR